MLPSGDQDESRKSPQYEQTILYACHNTRCSLSFCDVKPVWHTSHTNCSCMGRLDGLREVMSDCAASQNGQSKGIGFHIRILRKEENVGV